MTLNTILAELNRQIAYYEKREVMPYSYISGMIDGLLYARGLMEERK